MPVIGPAIRVLSLLGRLDGSCRCGPRGEPDHSLHVIDDVGEADFGSGPGDADGADEQAHRPFLPGEDVLDRRAHCRFARVGASCTTRHPPALGLLLVDLRAHQTAGQKGLVRL